MHTESTNLLPSLPIFKQYQFCFFPFFLVGGGEGRGGGRRRERDGRNKGFDMNIDKFRHSTINILIIKLKEEKRKKI